METTDTAAQVAMESNPDLPPDLRIEWMLRRAGYKEIQEFAKDLGLNPSTVSRILNGHRYENALTTLEAMAEKLNLTLDQLAALIKDMRAKGRYITNLLSHERLVWSALLPTDDQTIDLTAEG